LWLRKRVLIPLSLPLAVLLAGVVAYLRSDTSTIVVFNETGRTLPMLLIRACGQQKMFPPLAEEESVRFELKPRGGLSPVSLELATNPAWTWEGGTVKSRGGYRMVVRLLPKGEVESYTDMSWWRKLQDDF
jgi:hypothetical protein